MRTPRTFRAVPIGTTTLWTGHRNREGARKPGVAAPTTSKAYNTVHTHMYIRCVWWCQVELVNSWLTAPEAQSATAARGRQWLESRCHCYDVEERTPSDQPAQPKSRKRTHCSGRNRFGPWRSRSVGRRGGRAACKP